MNPGDFHIFSNRKLYNYQTLVFTKVSEISADNNVDIYPNPVSDYITIEVPGLKSSVEVSSIEGRLIFSQALPVDHRIDLSVLAKGVYIIHILGSNGENFTRKIVKM